ncbi:MAG: exosortase/archaeosortase family protein [Syntrophorhabdaceae bacterium]|nr:exosortase/archaeosortase family protein [Syntrophorhabdaceae bacterium]
MSHLLIWGLVGALYSPVIYQLYKARWETIDYTHAYFILPLSFFLAWRNLRNRDATAGKASSSGLFLVVLGLAMFIFGWKLDYLFISTLSLIPLLYGIIIYLYGTGMAKRLSFPILYLLLMVPPPLGVLDAITIPMRQGISEAAVAILNAIHYPIHREGLMLYLGTHEIFMGAPCSGFRSLITMFSLGIFYVYVIKGTLWKKLALVAAIIPLALLGNLIRVITLCLLTYHKGEKVAQGFFHYFSGGVIFVIMIVGLLVLEAVLERFEKKTGSAPRRGASQPK